MTVMKTWLLALSGLANVIFMVGRHVDSAAGASDLGLILLLTHGIHYLFNGLNEAVSPGWLASSPPVMIGAVAVLLGLGGLWFGIHRSKKT